MKIQSYTSTEIGVEFKVWAPTFNRVTHRLYLLGSLKELGTWAIEAALQAYPTTDFHIWRVQAALPPMSRFEWVWLKTNVKTQKVEWERPVKRNRALSCYSGVLHTVWGEHEEVFLQRAANVELTTFKKVGDGFALVLTGASPTLGAWDLHKAVPACEFPRRSGYWKANFSFDACTNLDFKWAIVKEKDRGSLLVQEKVPHHLYGRQTWMRVAAPWMTSSTVVVDILPLDETLDSKSGRTDVIIRERKRRLVEIRTWLVKARDAAGFGMQSMSDLTRPIMSPSRANRSQVEIKATPSRYANASPSTRMLRDEAIEQDIKKRAESDGERLTHQLSRDFRNQPQVFAIKGAGQKEMPTDVVNADITNQVPLMGCSLVLLGAADGSQEYDHEAEIATMTSKASMTSRSQLALSRSNIDKSKFYPQSRMRGPDQLKIMFAALEKKFEDFSKKSVQENEGAAEVELAIDLVTPSMPMTWSMLTEIDEDKTKNPTLAEHKSSRKTKRAPVAKAKVQRPSNASHDRTSRPSLSEVFKLKDQEQILVEAAAAARGHFSMSRTASVASSAGSIPATLGRDDTSKSAQDLTEESTNRIKWEQSRSGSTADVIPEPEEVE